MNHDDTSTCPVHAIIDASNPRENRSVRLPERQYALRISISESLYQKLVRAHQKVRLPDGSRVELRAILELALDSLLVEGARRSSSDPERAIDRQDDPATVRAPMTMRWTPNP
ncbi:MAG: hypothetical protein QM784_25425 [Polyangiaceae bacterium]